MAKMKNLTAKVVLTTADKNLNKGVDEKAMRDVFVRAVFCRIQRERTDGQAPFEDTPVRKNQN